jgi:hypothetical protein
MGMRRILRNNGGQIILALAIVMSIVILSVAFSIYQMNAGRQLLKYEPVKEIVLAATSDFDRTLTVALRDASLEFDETYDENNASIKGESVLQKWMRSAVMAFSHLGAKMEIMEREFKFNWNTPIGFSLTYADFSMDLETYGFRGWIGRSDKVVVLRIFNGTVRKTGDNSVTLVFNIIDNGKPVPNLIPGLLNVYVWNRNQSKWDSAEIVNMKYLGGGNYSLTFSSIVNEYELGLKLRAVTPKDGIIVSACYFRGINLNEVDWGTLYLSVGEEDPNQEYLLPYSLVSFKTRQATWVISKQKHTYREIASPPIPENIYIDMRETKSVNISIYVQPSPVPTPRKPAKFNVELFFYNSSSGRNESIIFEPVQFQITEKQGTYNANVSQHCGGIIPGGSIVYMRVTVISEHTLHIILNDNERLYSWVELGKAYYRT